MESKGPVVVANVPPQYRLGSSVVGLDAKDAKAAKTSALTGPSKIYEYLYLGSWRNLADIENLKRLGITGVINVSSNYKIMEEWAEANLKKHLDADFCFVNLDTDHSTKDTFLTAFDTAVRFIESHRPRGGKILVQCNNGIERSAAIVLGFVMRQERLSYGKALAKLRNQGVLIHTHRWLEEVLEDLDDAMPDDDVCC
jgi:Predicted protein-tyrosine phosphatase